MGGLGQRRKKSLRVLTQRTHQSHSILEKYIENFSYDFGRLVGLGGRCQSLGPSKGEDSDQSSPHFWLGTQRVSQSKQSRA